MVDVEGEGEEEGSITSHSFLINFMVVLLALGLLMLTENCIDII